MYPPRGSRRIVAVPFRHGREYGAIFWIQVEPLLSGVARNVGKEESSCQKERLIVGHLFDHADRMGSDVVVAFGRIVIVVRPNSPVHEPVIAERSFWDKLFRRSRADAAT